MTDAPPPTQSVYEWANDMLKRVRVLSDDAPLYASRLDRDGGGALNQDLVDVWLAIDILCKAIIALKDEETMHRVNMHNVSLMPHD